MTSRPSGRCAARDVLEGIVASRNVANETRVPAWVRLLAEDALAFPCCVSAADQEQVKARCRSVEHHLGLVDIHDAEEECNWARVEAAKSEIAAALALLCSNEEEAQDG